MTVVGLLLLWLLVSFVVSLLLGRYLRVSRDLSDARSGPDDAVSDWHGGDGDPSRGVQDPTRLPNRDGGRPGCGDHIPPGVSPQQPI
jgi:hypothetical protein